MKMEERITAVYRKRFQKIPTVSYYRIQYYVMFLPLRLPTCFFDLKPVTAIGPRLLFFGDGINKEQVSGEKP